jgi:hypothetical protein
MQIRYSIALEDHKAWQGAVRSAWPGFLMIRCTQSIGGPGFLLLCLWLFTYTQHGWWPTILAAGPALALGYYLWRASPGLWRKARLDMLHREGKLSGHIGEHTLEIGTDGLVERNAAGEHLSRWAEIENVYTTRSIRSSSLKPSWPTCCRSNPSLKAIMISLLRPRELVGRGPVANPPVANPALDGGIPSPSETGRHRPAASDDC